MSENPDLKALIIKRFSTIPEISGNNKVVDTIIKEVLSDKEYQIAAAADYARTYTQGMPGGGEYSRYDRTVSGNNKGDIDIPNNFNEDRVREIIKGLRND